MKKTYTKRQMTEAIAYWQRQLKMMNEDIYKPHSARSLIPQKIKDRFDQDPDPALQIIRQLLSSLTEVYEDNGSDVESDSAFQSAKAYLNWLGYSDS